MEYKCLVCSAMGCKLWRQRAQANLSDRNAHEYHCDAHTHHLFRLQMGRSGVTRQCHPQV